MNQFEEQSVMLFSYDGTPNLYLGWMLEGIKISTNSNYQDRAGANAPSGSPKTSFDKQLARQCQIKTMFDGYDGNINVYRTYIVPIQEAMNFVPGKRRPPVFRFERASEQWMRRCFVKTIDFSIEHETDVPVRAIANITLLEAEDLQPASAGGGSPNPTSAQRGSGGLFNTVP
jgi:hypothetical protein